MIIRFVACAFLEDLMNSTKMRWKTALRNRINMYEEVRCRLCKLLKRLLWLHFILVTESLSHNHVVLCEPVLFVEVVFYI
jgi:hypothetical protein